MDSTPNDFEINIFQWNSQSLRPKLHSFESLLVQENIHIAILSETWFDSNNSYNIRGYNMYRCDRSDCYGGVAIIVHKSIRSHLRPISLSNVGIEVIQIQILNCNSLENILAVYCPSSVRTSQADWDTLFSIHGNKTLIAGDFNGHHTNWSYKTDQRGSQLVDSSFENGFITLNNGQTTRVKLINGVLQQSSPDITFVTSDIAVKFRWSVFNENLQSDHLLIRITLNYIDQIKMFKRRNFKKADWSKYRSDLVEHFANNNMVTNIQESYDYFECFINQAANKNIPFIKICKSPIRKFKPKDFWNSNLSKAVAERRLTLSTFRRNPTPENLKKLEDKTKDTGLLISKARSDSFKAFCSNIKDTTSVADMWRKMRWFKGHSQSSSVVPDNIQKELLRSLTPDTALNQKPDINSRNDLLEGLFTVHELNCCLKKKDTAPGDDKITYSMLYNLPYTGKLYLLNLYNCIFSTGVIPKQWRTVLVIPIPKAQNSINKEQKFRPISLISCICKIFHSMISKRLEWFVENKIILSDCTSGFRRGQSCLDCLARFVSYVQIGLTHNNPTVACFLDVENAYNNVLVDKVVTILDELKVGFNICNYIWSYLSSRCLLIKNVDGVSESRWTNRGLAQGDPISPLLFNLVTYKICQEIDNVHIAQYADDFVFYISNRDIYFCESVLQEALNIMIISMNNLGLDISCNKSKVCLFSRGRRRSSFRLRINENRIELVENVKYLGMWLDRSLLWNRHINEIVEKVSKFLNLLKVLSGSKWGVHPKHLRTLYISVIRSRIDFGSFLYGNCANVHLLKLDRLQNQALRTIGGFIKTTPIHVMESELCIIPLHVRRLYLAFKFCLKSFSWTNNITINLLENLSELMNNSYWQRKKKPVLLESFDYCENFEIYSSKPLDMFLLDSWVSNIKTDEIIECNLESVIGSKKSHEVTCLKFEVLKEIYKKYNGWHKIFTDGSQSLNGKGMAYYDSTTGNSAMYKTDANICIMSLELVAILEALNYINDVSNPNVVIFTDSKSALQHIARCTSGLRGVSIAYDILKEINNLAIKGVNLKLQWIPSHIGIRGNEEADRLAKLAVLEGNYYFIKPNYTEQLFRCKEICYNNFKEYFDERSRQKGIWYKTIQCQPPRVPWFVRSKTSRSDVVIAHRLRSGHYPCKKFSFMMKVSDSPNCEVCGTVEDVHHLLIECAKNSSERDVLIDIFNLNRSDLGVFINMLASPASDGAKLLYNMFK